ncbi:MAG: hypothetical protein AAB568_03650 [Patescibacteria group bacterium]
MKKIIILILFLTFGFFLGSTEVKAVSGSCSAETDPNMCSVVNENQCGLGYIFIPNSSCGGIGNNKDYNFNYAGDFAKEAAGASGVDVRSTLESKVASIVNYALSLLGIVFLLLMVYGGYIWMMARGEEAEATRAKGIITMGVIGMAIVIAAYAITFFIVQRLVAGAA